MYRIKIAICICVALILCGITMIKAQESPSRAKTAAAKPNPGFAPGGTPTPRRNAASQAATRAVALCSGLWNGGRTIEQINADNGGLGGTESMKTDIDYSRKIVSIKYSDIMPPRIVAWRPVLGCVQLPIGATEDALQYVPQVAPDVACPDFDSQEWPMGDPRGAITACHLLHMSSGLYGEGGGSPQMDIYYGGATVEGRAVTNILDTMPGTRFLYNPPDTMLLMRAVREAVSDDRIFWAMPFQQLFWKIGMTRATPASDWNGDFLMSGQTYSSARDFARFGLLYLNDGVWNGERILPEGWTKFVSTPGPVQPEGNGPRYGGQFWIYDGIDGLPAKAYTPTGGQGQYAMIIPSHKSVVVRRGFDGRNGFKIAKFCADVLAVID